MKKIIILLSITISSLSFAQSYKTAVGIKGGYPGYGSLNIKHYISGSNALEGSIGGSRNFLWLQGLYEINKPLPTEGLNWYLGGGPNLGFFNGQTANSDYSLFISGSALIGIEYTFSNLPINIALDTGPSINVVPTFGFNWGGGLAVRYTLK